MQDTKAKVSEWVDCCRRATLWVCSRWVGVEQPADAIGLLMGIHGLFEPTYKGTFISEKDNQKAAKRQRLAHAGPGHGPGPVPAPHSAAGSGTAAPAGTHAGSLVAVAAPALQDAAAEPGESSGASDAGDADMAADNPDDIPEPEKELSDEQRQSCYQKNVITWLESQPAGRLFVFRKNIGIEQAAQGRLIRSSGYRFECSQLKADAAGKQRIYPALNGARGLYTIESLKEYSVAVFQSSEWEISLTTWVPTSCPSVRTVCWQQDRPPRGSLCTNH